jgi:hypothetical protein
MNIWEDETGYWWYESLRFTEPVGPFGSRRTALHDAKWFEHIEDEGGES